MSMITKDEALKIFLEEKPKDRGIASKLIRKTGEDIDSKTFNEAVKAYEDKTGGKLPKSELAQQVDFRRKCLAEAHQMSAEEIKELLDKENKDEKETATTWQAFNIFKEGKFDDDELSVKDFEPLFATLKDVPLDEDIINWSIDVLLAQDNLDSRGEAWKVLTSSPTGSKTEDLPPQAIQIVKQGGKLFNEIILRYEAETNTKLPESEETKQRKEVAKKVHNMTAQEVTEYTDKAEGMDAICWEISKLGNERKWTGLDVTQFPVFKRYQEGT